MPPKHHKNSHWNQKKNGNAKKAALKTLNDTCVTEWHRCFRKRHVLVNSQKMRMSQAVTETCVWALLIYPRPSEKQDNSPGLRPNGVSGSFVDGSMVRTLSDKTAPPNGTPSLRPGGMRARALNKCQFMRANGLIRRPFRLVHVPDSILDTSQALFWGMYENRARHNALLLWDDLEYLGTILRFQQTRIQSVA